MERLPGLSSRAYAVVRALNLVQTIRSELNVIYLTKKTKQLSLEDVDAVELEIFTMLSISMSDVSNLLLRSVQF